MDELQDYSGPFNPNLRPEHLSKEMLITLLKEYQRAYLTVLGEWLRVVRERFGDVEAVECDISMWMVAGPLVARNICNALKIKPGDVESYFKLRQMDPGFPMTMFDIVFELVNPKLGYMTVRNYHLPGDETFLEQADRGEAAREFMVPVFHLDDAATGQNSAFFHNRNLVYKNIKLAPPSKIGEIASKSEAKIVAPEENPFPYWQESKRMGPGVPHDPKEASKPWSEEQIRTVWGLLTEGVRQVLRVMASKPEGCSEKDIAQELGISVEDVAARLGYVYIAIFESPWPQKWSPLRWELNPFQFEMDKEWAKVVPKL